MVTYGEISRYLLIKDPRVVGWALHANKNSKVPCHRVVNKEGRLAKNFAYGGEKAQREKLEKEGIGFKDKIHVNFSKYGIIIKK